MRTHRSPRALLGCVLSTVVLAVGSSACTSRMRGGKTRDLGSPPGPSAGVPFRISKPVFFVAPVPVLPSGPAAAPEYGVFVEYKSDPDAVYWANIDPALFHSSTFDLVFPADGHGVLSQVTSKGEDKSSGFVTAVGSFAVGAISVLAATKAQDDAERAFFRAGLGGAGGLYVTGNLTPPEAAAARERAASEITEVTKGTRSVAEEGLRSRLLVVPGGDGTPQPVPNDQMRILADAAGRLAEEVDPTQMPQFLLGLRAALAFDDPSVRLRALTALAEGDATDSRTIVRARRARDALSALMVLKDAVDAATPEWRRTLVLRLKGELARIERRDAEDASISRMSDGFRAAEALLYKAVRMEEAYAQKRALEEYLRRPPYGGAAGAAPEAVSQMAEVEKARAAVQAIHAAFVAQVDRLAAPAAGYVPPSSVPWRTGGKIYPTALRYPQGVRGGSVSPPDPEAYATSAWLEAQGLSPGNGEYVIVIERGFHAHQRAKESR